MGMSMAVRVRMLMIMSMAFSVLVLMIMPMALSTLMAMPMILHVHLRMPVACLTMFRLLMFMSMVMPMFMPLFLQMHIKIIRIQPAFHRPAKMEMVSLHAQAAECPLQNFSVGAKIQKRSDRHISANSRITFQIQYFPHLFHRQSVYLCCQITCAVSIIDIYHGNPVRAGIQHGQEG